MKELIKIAKNYEKEFGKDQMIMAASISSLNYCIKLINTFEIHNILDMGSGLSTLTFHLLADQVDGLEITSVDDSPEWAARTEELALRYTGKKINVDVGLEKLKDKAFDFVFYDYGNMESRIFHYPKVSQMARKFIYADDLHFLFYRQYLIDTNEDFKLSYLPETVDEIGRFGALLTRKSML